MYDSPQAVCLFVFHADDSVGIPGHSSREYVNIGTLELTPGLWHKSCHFSLRKSFTIFLSWGVGRRQKWRVRQGKVIGESPLSSVIIATSHFFRNKMDICECECLVALTETWLKEDLHSHLETAVTWQGPNSDWEMPWVGGSVKTGAALWWSGRCCVVLISDFYPFPSAHLFTEGVSADICTFIQRHVLTPPLLSAVIHYCGYGTQATRQTGDFNLCRLWKLLPNFYQLVTCPTGHMRCLDLCYGSIKGTLSVRTVCV